MYTPLHKAVHLGREKRVLLMFALGNLVTLVVMARPSALMTFGLIVVLSTLVSARPGEV